MAFILRCISIGLLSGIPFMSLAQPGSPAWFRCMGGAAYEHAQTIKTTSDGGSIFIGSTNSFDGDVEGIHFATDVWVVKLDEAGETEWSKCLGGDGIDEGYDILELPSGGYVLVGNANSLNGDVSGVHDVFQDAWMVRLNSEGEIDWATSIGGNSVEYFYSVAQSGSNFIAVGLTCSDDEFVSGGLGACDVYIVNVDFTGSVGTTYRYGSAWNDQAKSIAPTPDGGFIIAAEIGGDGGNVEEYFGQTDIWLLKTDYSGELEWQKTLGGTSMDVPRKIKVLSDGSFLLCGESSSTDGDIGENNGFYDGWLVKLSASGTIQWERSIGGPGYDGTFDAIELSNQQIVAVSEVYASAEPGDQTPHGGTDVLLTALDASGNVLWESWYGGSALDRPYSITKKTDEIWLVAGETNSLDGDIDSLRGNDDVFVFQLGESEIITTQKTIKQSVIIYPQPAQNKVILDHLGAENQGTYHLFDAFGRIVVRGTLSGESSKTIDLTGISPGIYILVYPHLSGVQRLPVVITTQP